MDMPLERTSSLSSIDFFDNEKGLVFGEGGLIFTSDSTLITSRKQIDPPISGFVFVVYPIPATDFININIENVYSFKGLTLDVVSVDGKVQNTLLIRGSTKKLSITATN
jgi:hypothetical protein